VRKAKEDALFRSVYSSFAPSEDDSLALVPAKTKRQAWWHKVGERKYDQIIENESALVSDSAVNASEMLIDPALEMSTLQDAVESFEPEAGMDMRNGVKDNEVEGLLREISELLETLSSYQRNRNVTLASTPRTPLTHNSSFNSMTGTPSRPSSAEVDIYQMLRSQLTLMISSLPPYAVAKLDGDQLEELSISRNILVEDKEYKGIMDEDQATRIAKAAALSAAAAPPSLTRMGSSSATTQFPNSVQYARPAAPAAHAPTARPTPSQYYPQQQAPNRTPSSSHYPPRPPSAIQSYQTPGMYSSSTSRPSYSQSQASYSQPAARPGYSASGPSQYYQSLPTKPQSYSQYYQGTPVTQNPNRGYQTSPAASTYQQRPQNPAGTYGYQQSQSPQVRTASPMQPAPRPGGAVQQQQYPQQQRPSFNTPTSTQPRQYFQAPAGQTSQYGSQPATPSGLGPSGYHSAMSSSDQQSMMDRQRAQLAMQPQTRMAPQANMTRQGSGTPQPSNSQYQANGSGGSPMVA